MRPLHLNPSNQQLQREALALFGQKHWAALIALVRSQRAETAYTTIRVLGEAAPMEARLDDLVGLGNAFALTLAGGLLYHRAFRIRGLGSADTVSDQEAEAYAVTLFQAQQLLREANEMEPSLGLPAGWRATAFVEALEEDKRDAEAAVRRAVEVPVSGLSRLLTAFTQKWGGSHEDMWRIARTYADHDPPGSLALIAKAYFEQWLWLAHFEEDPRGQYQAHDYLLKPEMLDELETLSARVLAEDDHPDPRNILHADNWLARMLIRCGRRRQARPHLQRIGRNYDGTVWTLISPRLHVNLARLRALLPPV